MALVATYPKQWPLVAIPEPILRKLCGGGSSGGGGGMCVHIRVCACGSVCVYVYVREYLRDRKPLLYGSSSSSPFSFIHLIHMHRY